MIDGVTYRFDAAGYMRTGWVFEGGQWFYHAASGAQVSGWVLSGVSWYYLVLATGAMATGWVQVGATWYYLETSAMGAMHTGWLSEGAHCITSPVVARWRPVGCVFGVPGTTWRQWPVDQLSAWLQAHA